jgi:hypothetical protein
MIRNTASIDTGGKPMPQRIMTSLWDFIAQKYRNTVRAGSSSDMDYRLSDEDYSVAETAWRTLGACERWSAVLAGAETSEEALEQSPKSVELIQAASDLYPPGQFPEDLPSSADRILERADDVLATISAQLAELGPTQRNRQYSTWWGESYSGDEIVARIIWTMGYADGQIRQLFAANRHGV